ncbi:helix-turn-helix domain-containing protein [Nonomuraea sp. K274]|uniref:Helix-turn-helix domain-containing protein n=1 Tax=Nonomuraea cypriaca TaxID=1187855 RepID=A0A931AML5_9ACTN|nr:helix-turn-helix transcriptional regulator [Nonomuraea cypriaca]MBF8193000.1 helix-turn-helix domain-containing protein [Nonomuraea cypriaca]
MDVRAELGAFLRSRRARLQPEDAGLIRYGERRRVPGLRREELAQLAGVSADYYTRFEQGRGEHVSGAIVDAVAAALRLDDAERAHLHNLARAVHPRPLAAAPQQVRPGLRQLLDAMSGTPAFIIGRRMDVLAWNPLFASVILNFGAIPPVRRNKVWVVFTHEEMRSRYVNWPAKARDVLAYLRMDHGRHPGDPAFPALIEELSERSPDFRRMWAEQEVRDKTHGTYDLWHPTVGALTLSYETFRAADDPDQALIAYTAAPGSPSEAALGLLRGVVSPA